MAIETSGLDEDKKIEKILKRVNKKAQFGLGQVPSYGKSRSNKEYGGFIKESSYNKLKYRGNKTKSRLLFPEPKDEYEIYLNENYIETKKGPYEI